VLLDRAVAAAPDDPLARSYLAVALARSGGGFHEAARHGRFAVDRRPREAAFLFNLAEVYAMAGFGPARLPLRARLARRRRIVARHPKRDGGHNTNVLRRVR
jgi:Flp pilus assembly protein TadD